ncbi:MAG TPA: hypothetical protein PL105_21420 [Caldilineaceae bacterium]|nr:hypothetical protein [Caldilineaceae bacterium]
MRVLYDKSGGASILPSPPAPLPAGANGGRRELAGLGEGRVSMAIETDFGREGSMEERNTEYAMGVCPHPRPLSQPG